MNCLSGIRIIDLSQFLSASYCTQILGDLGADVIKIEQPGKGEVYRTYGPRFINGESTSFLSINRNKRSLSLNIKDKQGVNIIHRLVETADVFVENFRPGKLKKYDLDYQTLKQINPCIIYCSVSGFGQTGPYADKGGFDLTAQAMSGLMSVTGQKNGPPQKVGYPVTDIGAGMYAAIGILAALIARGKTGKGQLVDTSLFETGVSWGMMAALNYFADGSIQERMGSASPQNAPYQAFVVQDGAFTVGTGNEILWRKFCEIFELDYLLNNPKYVDNASRVNNQEILAREIEEGIKDLHVAECLIKLDQAGIPCGPINSIDQVIEDPQTKARGMIIEFDHIKAGKVKNLAFPVKMSENPADLRYAPPLLGQHSKEILLDLGFSQKQITELIKVGTIEGRD